MPAKHQRWLTPYQLLSAMAYLIDTHRSPTSNASLCIWCGAGHFQGFLRSDLVLFRLFGYVAASIAFFVSFEVGAIHLFRRFGFFSPSWESAFIVFLVVIGIYLAVEGRGRGTTGLLR